MKQFFLVTIFLTAAGMANANLVQQNFALIAHHVASNNSPAQQIQTVLKVVNNHTNGLNKTDSMYSRLFDYASHIDQTADHEGLAAFWKGTLIRHAIDTVIAQKQVDTSSLPAADTQDIAKIAADSLNDQYSDDNKRINEVPLPVAAWLFASAIVLFGFARRNNI